jgi:uncharacterized surface protein with fasciclin (FAS1) repeats
MRIFKAISLFASSLAFSSIIAMSLNAAAWNTSNNQWNPKIPQSMMSKNEPMEDPNSKSNSDASKSVVDLIVTDPSLSALSQALKSADLIETLSGAGPFTIFAPNDAAFAKISPNVLSDLLKTENKDKLLAILTYHVVPGQLKVEDLKSTKIKNLLGKTLDVKVTDQDISINNAKVVKPEMQASNGIVYIVDTVLMQ